MMEDQTMLETHKPWKVLPLSREQLEAVEVARNRAWALEEREKIFLRYWGAANSEEERRAYRDLQEFKAQHAKLLDLSSMRIRHSGMEEQVIAEANWKGWKMDTKQPTEFPEEIPNYMAQAILKRVGIWWWGLHPHHRETARIAVDLIFRQMELNCRATFIRPWDCLPKTRWLNGQDEKEWEAGIRKEVEAREEAIEQKIQAREERLRARRRELNSHLDWLMTAPGWIMQTPVHKSAIEDASQTLRDFDRDNPGIRG